LLTKYAKFLLNLYFTLTRKFIYIVNYDEIKDLVFGLVSKHGPMNAITDGVNVGDDRLEPENFVRQNWTLQVVQI